MRAVALAALATSLFSATALAADFDPGPLRGTQYIEPVPAPVTIWEGPYFGGFGGVTQSHFEYQNSFSNLVAGLSNVRDTMLEKEYAVSTLLHGVGGKDRHTTSYGGFAGYNWQFEDVVFGFEVDYVHARLNGSRSDSIGRIMVTSDNVSHDVYLTGTASAELQDYGSVRVRAGYTSGPFLPFITAGVAFGGLNTGTTVTARLAGYDQTAYNAWLANQTLPTGSIYRYGYSSFNPYNLQARVVGAGVTGDVSKSTVAVGFTAGAGLDFALTQNIFLRAEYQYAWFDDFSGHKLNVNTVRGGVGVKF